MLKSPKFLPILTKIALASAMLLVVACGESSTHGGDHHAKVDLRTANLSDPAIHSHEQAGETCFICDASKRDENRLWCREHGRYEDRCWVCHPELEDKERLFCKEHGLYEDECHLCRPISDTETGAHDTGPTETKQTAEISPELFCNEHQVAEIECAICQPQLAAALQPGGSMKIRFASDVAAQKAGIQAEKPEFIDASPNFEAYCEVQYNQNQLAKITPLAHGIIRQVFVDVGDRVEAGDVLLTLHSTEVGNAKSDYLAAIVNRTILEQNLERETRLKEEKIVSEQAYLEKEAIYQTALLKQSNLRQRLANLGLTDEEIHQVEAEQNASAELYIRAPFAGTLVERMAVIGEAADAGQPLFTLTDLSSLWLSLSLPAQQIHQVEIGQQVEATFAELPATIFTGEIDWIDSAIDHQTKMVRARAHLWSPDSRLKVGMFGKARIYTQVAAATARIPREAVQQHEGAPFVFVPNEPGLFSLRRVELGQTNDAFVHVVAGLNLDDTVVTQGSFIVMSEFLKSRLGAGCVHQ